MALEIEHKFLIATDAWRNHIEKSTGMRQAYLASRAKVTVRVRITDDSAWLTLKGARSGIAQHEFEFEIPQEEAAEIIGVLSDSSVVEKTRHTVMHAGHEWVIDEFHGDNQGLLVAEIELASIDEAFEIPPWAGANVTADKRYRNKFLAHNPFSTWSR